MKKITILLLMLPLLLLGQSNIRLSNGSVLSVLKANYNPASYAPTTSISGHDQILCELQNNVSTDTLQAYLEKLASFSTRNTWSDTSSGTRGIGAARRWVHQKFVQYGSRNENRLLPAYLVFDVTGNVCGDLYGTKNVLGVLPGRDTTHHDILIIEGHMDSRCAGRCDTSCAAPGVEDNGSGTALVMELARLMSRYHFDRTIVFMATTGRAGPIGCRGHGTVCH
ncbi:MAG: M28 family peptidase [Owenweeksia sp.]|nr:M28 family peptidase [Owenweeksia sp.]